MEDYTARDQQGGPAARAVRAPRIPNDFEAIGYPGLGATPRSTACGPAGKAFDAAIKGLEVKDPKKKDVGDQQPQLLLGEGVQRRHRARSAPRRRPIPSTSRRPDERRRQERQGRGGRELRTAALSPTSRALLLRPGDRQTIRNLGSVYALTWATIRRPRSVLREGLNVAPTDTMLLARRSRWCAPNYANQLADGQEVRRGDRLLRRAGQGRAEQRRPLALAGRRATSARAQSEPSGDARKAGLQARGRRATRRLRAASPTTPTWRSTRRSRYQNAADVGRSPRRCGSRRSSCARTTPTRSRRSGVVPGRARGSPTRRSSDAAQRREPASRRTRSYHRQLGAIYTKAGNNAQGTEELMVYLAMQNGQPVADAAAAAKAAKQGPRRAQDARERWRARPDLSLGGRTSRSTRPGSTGPRSARTPSPAAAAARPQVGLEHARRQVVGEQAEAPDAGPSGRGDEPRVTDSTAARSRSSGFGNQGEAQALNLRDAGVRGGGRRAPGGARRSARARSRVSRRSPLAEAAAARADRARCCCPTR